MQRKHRSGLGDQLDRTWYEQHRHSFELVESESVPRVRLTPSARERAELRSLEREREKLRMQERRVAEAVLAELSPRLQDLPRSCEGKELAALLIALQHRASRCDTQKTAASSSEAEALQLPGALPVIVKRLMERAHERRTTGGGKHVLAAELLEELHPFNAAQVRPPWGQRGNTARAREGVSTHSRHHQCAKLISRWLSCVRLGVGRLQDSFHFLRPMLQVTKPK